MSNRTIEWLIVLGLILTGVAVAGAVWANPHLDEYNRWLWTSADVLVTTVVVVIALVAWKEGQ